MGSSSSFCCTRLFVIVAAYNLDWLFSRETPATEIRKGGGTV